MAYATAPTVVNSVGTYGGSYGSGEGLSAEVGAKIAWQAAVLEECDVQSSYENASHLKHLGNEIDYTG